MNKGRKLGYYHGSQTKFSGMGSKARSKARRRHGKVCRRLDRAECKAAA